MSCAQSTSPVNIINNPQFNCDLKCDFSYNYTTSPVLIISNKGEYLSIKLDSVQNITYNASTYSLNEMRIYQPSLHSYNGKKTDAELIIIHTRDTSVGNLLVCVPIMTGSANSDSLAIIDKIVSNASLMTNSSNKTTNVNIPTFSVKTLIPLKPYYSYSGTLPYPPCNGEYDYIVFNKDENATLSISSKAFNALSKIITKNAYPIRQNGGVFYNKKGPSPSTNTSDDIYMECVPTGSDGEQLVPIETSTNNMFDNHSIQNFYNDNKWVLWVVIGIILTFSIKKLGSIAFNKIAKNKN
jgi:carbonic anhydrase